MPHRDGRRHPDGAYRAGLRDRGRGPGAQGHGDPPFSVVVGSPAKVIKTLDEGSLAERLDHTQHYYHLAMENKASWGCDAPALLRREDGSRRGRCAPPGDDHNP